MCMNHSQTFISSVSLGLLTIKQAKKIQECIEGRNLLFHDMGLIVYSPVVMWGREALQTAMEDSAFLPHYTFLTVTFPLFVMGKQVSVCIIIIDIFLTTGSWYNLFQSKLNKPGSLNLTFYLVTALSFQLHSPLFASALLPYSVISFLYCLAYVCSYTYRYKFSSVQFSHSVMWPHESQHARPPCPSPTPGVHSDSSPSRQWCHPAISSSVDPFSSYPQSLPASGSFPMNQLFTWGGQSTGVSALASFLPKKSQGWPPSEWTGWISL